MPRRPAPEPVSPRALARLRSPRGGFVPTVHDLQTGTRPARGDGSPGSRAVGGADGDRWRRGRDGDGGVPRGEVDGSAAFTASARHSRAALPRRWFRLPASVVGARWGPGRAAILGVVLVVVLAVAVFGLRVAWASSSGGGTVLAPGGGSRAGPTGVTAGAVSVGVPGGGGTAGGPSGTTGPGATGSGATGSGAAGTSSASPAPSGGAGAGGAAASVVVHVVGQVRRPGVQHLPVGSRVEDAVKAAGGATPKADLARVNLARVLVDGEQVRVPAPGDPDPPVGGVGGSSGGGGAAPGAGGGAAGTSGPVSINTADLAGLDTLPGVGPVLAQRILDWRGEHGRFTTVDELGEVSGIGEKLLAQLRPLVTL